MNNYSTPLLKHLALRHKRAVAVIAAVVVVYICLSLIEPQIVSTVLDHFLTARGPSIPLFTGWLFAIAIGSRGFRRHLDLRLDILSSRIREEVIREWSERLLGLSFQSVEQIEVGSVLETIQRAARETAFYARMLLADVFLGMISLVFMLTYLFIVSRLVFLFTALIVPIVAWAGLRVDARRFRARAKESHDTGALADDMLEHVRAIESIKAMGLEAEALRRIQDRNATLHQSELVGHAVSSAHVLQQAVLIHFARAGVVGVAAMQLISRSISPGQFYVIFSYSILILNPLCNNLLAMLDQRARTRAATVDLERYLPKVPVRDFRASRHGAREFQSLRLIDASYKYPDASRFAIHDLSLELPAGGSVAFVGRTGSGKSTALRMCLGLYVPTHGRAVIDAERSWDVEKTTLSQQVGYITGDMQLLNDTLRENLRFANPSASDDMCLQALREAAVLDAFPTESPLDCHLGSGGLRLSSGERQRVAIARALVRNPSILAFDEGTNHLDMSTEATIFDTLVDIKRRRRETLLIVVTHSLQLARRADKLFIFEGGRVSDHGSHCELLARSKAYQAMWAPHSSG